MKSSLESFIERAAGKQVLVVGDLMLDEYQWGSAPRLSAEAPVPVVEIQRRTFAVGGAGNAAANVASLGGIALLGAVVGADRAARWLARGGADLTPAGSQILAGGRAAARPPGHDARGLPTP